MNPEHDLHKDKLAPEGLMYAILATSCPVDVLEDNWMVHRIELCDVTWEIEARCISTPSQDQVENGDLWLFKQEIRSARILKWDAVRNMLV